MDRNQIARQHENDAPYERSSDGGMQVPQKKVCGDAGKGDVEYDEPVPGYAKGEEEIERMGWIEDARLQGCKKRDTRVVVGVPQRHLKGFYQGNP